MRDSKRRATLTAALLSPSDAARRVDICLVNQSTGADPVAVIARRRETVAAPLFYEKGAASGDGFDPLGHLHPQPQIGSATSSPRSTVRRVRVWFRIDALRRSQLKLAAAYKKQTCQALLTSAVESFIIECAAISDAAAASLVLAMKGAGRQSMSFRRHKIAIWVRPEHRDRTRAMAARLGQTLQALLQAALDDELDRLARSERALGRLFAATAEKFSSLATSPSNELWRSARAMPIGAQIISFRSARQARSIALAAGPRSSNRRRIVGNL